MGVDTTELVKWAFQQGGLTLIALAAIGLLYVVFRERLREAEDRRACEEKRADTVTQALIQQAVSNDKLRTSIDRLIQIIDRSLETSLPRGRE